MDEKAVGGVSWTLLTYASSKLLTFGATIVLARLLVPADFGLVALATLAIGLLRIFSNLGFGALLILRPDAPERTQGTVLTVMLCMGFIVAGVVASLSPLAATAFDEPRLDGVLALLSATVAISGFSGFYEIVLQRELEFRRRFVGALAQSLTYVVLALLLAALGAGVWSLVAGQVAAVAAYAATLVSLAPYRVRPAFDRGAVREVLAAGHGFVIQSGVSFLQQNADSLAIGRLLGATQLGFYSMAFRLNEFLYLAIADPVANVTFPGFARMHARGDSVIPSFLSVLRLIALVACPLGVLLSASADPFTRAVFGDKWLPMIGPLSVLGIWAAVRQLEYTLGWLFNSLGQATLNGLVTVLTLVPLVPAVVVAADRGGTTAVAWVMVANVVLTAAVLVLLAGRRLGVSPRDLWLAIRPVAIASPVTWVAARLVADATAGGLPTGVGLAASMAAGLATYLAVVWILDPRALVQGTAQVRRIVRRAPGAADGGPPAVDLTSP